MLKGPNRKFDIVKVRDSGCRLYYFLNWENTKYVIGRHTYDNRHFWNGALSDIVWWFSAFVNSWYWLTVLLLVDCLQVLNNVTGGFFLRVEGTLDGHPNFIIYLIVWLLYYIIFWFYLRSVDDTKVNIFIYKYAQTGVICWAEEGPKWNVIPTINFLLFLRLNGSVNGLKSRIYYYY